MEKRMKIIPSIASADQLSIREEILRLGSWKKLHIDIEDGNFVPNITFGEKMVRGIADIFPQELDAHLMTECPEQYLKLLQECRVKSVAVHLETVRYPLTILNHIMDRGTRPALALNISTPAEAVMPFAERIDYVIVMTAEPDGRGQRFYPPMLDKIRSLRDFLPPQVAIWADGGINEANLVQIAAAGADTVVMGRCVFGCEDPFKLLVRLSI